MNPLCIYHSKDLDGVCSGAIVKHFVPDCEMFGYDYGQEFPWHLVPGAGLTRADLRYIEDEMKKFSVPVGTPILIGGPTFEDPLGVGSVPPQKRTVYMVDVSLNDPADMKRLADVAELIFIDHHKTALDALCGLHTAGYQTEHLSACELTWLWFTRPKDDPMLVRGVEPTAEQVARLPEVVRLLGRYDVWDKENPEWEKILAYQYGFRTRRGAYDPNDSWYSFLFGGALTDAGREAEIYYTVAIGRAILSFVAEQNSQIARVGAFERTLSSSVGGEPFDMDGALGITPRQYRCICLNTPIFNSQAFDSVYDPEKHDLMVPFAKAKDGRWKVSLYSTKPEIDCGAICKTFGGGGHKGAAGFICDKLPWEK